MINIYGPDVPFEAATNTLFDILIIVILYFIGNFFRAVGLSRQKKKLKKQVRLIPNYQELSKYELLERVNEEKPSWWRTKGRSILSLLTLTAVVIALISFTFGWEYSILDLPFYTISIQDLLLLAINVYYGFRD